MIYVLVTKAEQIGTSEVRCTRLETRQVCIRASETARRPLSLSITSDCMMNAISRACSCEQDRPRFTKLSGTKDLELYVHFNNCIS